MTDPRRFFTRVVQDLTFWFPDGIPGYLFYRGLSSDSPLLTFPGLIILTDTGGIKDTMTCPKQNSISSAYVTKIPH
jgi:hypothetical protein